MVKTVLITGSSKGLGRCLALVFSKNKYNVIIHGRNKEGLENVKKEVLKNKVSCEVVIGDIKDAKTIDKLANLAKERDISVLINNAGIMSKDFVQAIKDEEVDEVLNVNLSSAIKLTSKVYPLFLDKKSGVIININSTGGLMPSEEQSLYTASKHGLKGFTDCLRIEAKKNNVKILGVYLAGMRTTFHDRVGGRKNIETTMKPEEVAKIIFDLIDYDTVHVDEITLTRKNK